MPYVRDDRETPLCVGRDAKRCRCDLGGTKTEIFFQRGLDCPNQIEKSQQIVRQARSLGLLMWPARSPDQAQRRSSKSLNLSTVRRRGYVSRLCFWPSSSAKADDPVFRSAGGRSRSRSVLDTRFAGLTAKCGAAHCALESLASLKPRKPRHHRIGAAVELRCSQIY